MSMCGWQAACRSFHWKRCQGLWEREEPISLRKAKAYSCICKCFVQVRFNELVASAIDAIESAANDDANHARWSRVGDSGRDNDNDHDIGPGHLAAGPWSRIEKFSVEEQTVQVYAWLNCTYTPLCSRSSSCSPPFRPRELSIAVAVEYTFDVQAHDIVLRVEPAVLPMLLVFVVRDARDIEAVASFRRENDIARVADEIVIVVAPPGNDDKGEEEEEEVGLSNQNRYRRRHGYMPTHVCLSEPLRECAPWPDEKGGRSS